VLRCRSVITPGQQHRVISYVRAGRALAYFTVRAWLGLHQVGVLYALVAVESAVLAVNEPARRSLTPALLPPGQLAAGLALQRITFQVMLIGGPALAGVVAAVPHLGLRGCYLIDTASFAAALYGAGRLTADNSKKRRGAAELPDAEKTKKEPHYPERTPVASVLADFSFIGRTPVLAGAFLADLAATAASSARSRRARSVPWPRR